MGADTARSTDAAFQPRRFTTYERDQNGSDEAMSRRYNRAHARFDQPDPYAGSYDLSDPQSFNRYSYVQNDPVNFIDPSGLAPQICQIYHGELVCDEDKSLFPAGAGADQGYSGFGGFGGGFDLDDRPRAGFGIISLRENASDPHFHAWFDPWERITKVPFPSIFTGWSAWAGFFPQEKPQLERNLSHDTKNYDFWNKCLVEAGADQLGITEALVGLANMPVPKSWIRVPTLPGASRVTNPISAAGHIFARGANLPFKVLETNRIFGIAGRAMPGVGAGLAAYDVARTLQKANACYDQHAQ